VWGAERWMGWIVCVLRESSFPIKDRQQLTYFSHSVTRTSVKMQNDAGDNVDLYIPRKW
jgi:hypothetical protein